MNIRVERNWLLGDTTIGRLFVDGRFFSYTLEDKVRNEKIYGETAIPYGKYDVDITYSPHFKRDMPLIRNVKGFSGIRIHSGSSIKSTDGCLLVGSEISKDKKLLNSRATFNELYKDIDEALKRGEKITIDFVQSDKTKIIIGTGLMVGLSALALFTIYKTFIKNEKLF